MIKRPLSTWKSSLMFLRGSSKRNKSRKWRTQNLIWFQRKKSQRKEKCLKSTSFKITPFSLKIVKLSLEFQNSLRSLLKKDPLQQSRLRLRPKLSPNSTQSKICLYKKDRWWAQTIWIWEIFKGSTMWLTRSSLNSGIIQTPIFLICSHRLLCFQISLNRCCKKLNRPKGILK